MEVKQAILQKIQEYSRIMLFRHVRPDGDCLGASKGLKAMLQLSFPEKEIILTDGAQSEYLAFMGEDDAPVPDEYYADALGIVVDTASVKRISNPKYVLCKELIKIDHHIPLEPYGNIAWIEEDFSSCCEMIAELHGAFPEILKLDAVGAACLYTGMVTDSGRFRYSEVKGDTLRRAALLLDKGVDTQALFAQLYTVSFEYLKFKACVYRNMEITENGVAYVYIDKAMQEEFGLSLETASAAVGFMESIRGCICWVAFIETGDEQGSIRVRLRSRFMHINSVAEHFRGGGHACASGATVFDRNEVNALLQEADELTKQYKQTHEGWL